MSDSATPWTVTHKAPLSMEFSRQEYWNGLPCPPPGDLPYQGVEPRSSSLQADCLPAELPGKPLISYNSIQNWKFKRLKKLMTCLFWLWFYLVHFCQNFIGKIFFEFNMEIWSKRHEPLGPEIFTLISYRLFKVGSPCFSTNLLTYLNIGEHFQSMESKSMAFS